MSDTNKVIVFNSISLDGYFTDERGNMSWAHVNDPEYNAFVDDNAKGGGVLVFGRITYDLMAGFWPTPMAMKNFPVVADRMNAGQKIVFSRTMEKATWNYTTLVKNDIAGAVRKAKQESGMDLVIMGSGSIVSQLTDAGVIDEYQFVVVPVVLGKGRTLFEGVREKLSLKMTKTRAFRNGCVFLTYEPLER